MPLISYVDRRVCMKIFLEYFGLSLFFEIVIVLYMDRIEAY
jgi:hypothetical protein